MSATATAKDAGTIYRIAGPVVTAININPRMYDVVLVGNEKLMGEVIQIEGGKTIIQVYEDTSGLRPGEPVSNTGGQLSVELGPGLLQSIYDGIQRPLPILMEQMGDQFPTYEAERLAARFLEAGRAHPGEPVLEPGGMADVWKLTAPGGRAIALYRSATIVSVIRGLASGLNVTVSTVPLLTAPPP